jgi:hypothetical protein
MSDTMNLSTLNGQNLAGVGFAVQKVIIQSRNLPGIGQNGT